MPLNAKLGMVVVPSKREDLARCGEFYSEIFGIRFIRTATDLTKTLYAPISIDGTMFSIEGRDVVPERTENDSARAIFIVDDLGEAEEKLVALGGTLVGDRFTLPMSDKVYESHFKSMTDMGRHPEQISRRLGEMRRMRDPAGNLIALFRIEADSEFWFKTGAYRVGMSINQIEHWKKEIEVVESLDLEPI